MAIYSTLLINRSGTVESRIRQLVMKLEYVDTLILAHPFIKGFDQVSHCINQEEVRSVASGDISETVAKRKKEDIEGKEGASTVYSTTFFIGLAIEPKQRASLTNISELEDRSRMLCLLTNYLKLDPLPLADLTSLILPLNLPSLSRCGKNSTNLQWGSSSDISGGSDLNLRMTLLIC